MTELEKAAREYAKRYSSDIHNDGIHTVIPSYTARNSFEAGAQWQVKQSPWIRTEDRLPEDNELVLTSSSIYGTKLLVWNEFHKVWDDEDGDDTYCDRDKIDAWMPIPE